MDDFIARFCAFDTETKLIVPGNLAPDLICSSWARARDGQSGIVNAVGTTEIARLLAGGGDVIAGANIAYDMGVLAVHDPTGLKTIFRAYDEDRVWDVQVAQALDAVAGGHLGLDPRTGKQTRDPETGKESGRYSLAICVDLVLGRADAKARDDWRLSYGLLDGIPIERWPEKALTYPVDDAVNTLAVAVAQATGIPYHDGQGSVGPARNLGDLAMQCRAALALHFGACWGIRTSRSRTEKLAAEVEAKHTRAVERYKEKRWIRADGSEDQSTVKRAVATAYGATGDCNRSGGKRRVCSVSVIECRGAKIKGRYAGCRGAGCALCDGRGSVMKAGNEVTCKVVMGENGDEGCDGTGLDLSTAAMLPRTEKGGVATDRDTMMESGDDDLSDYGEAEFEKIRTTYIPYLRRGYDAPINLRPNVLVASGRCSYSDPIHQFPREGGVRECVVARDGYYFGSTDYEAGELCTLSTYCYWVLGYSKMRDDINAYGKPGVLHSVVAAEVLGLPLADFLNRLKMKDEQAVKFRQASKCVNFGRPGGMGTPKLVLTSRKKNAGSTTLPNGTKIAGIRFCVLVGGAERCGVEKITMWKDRPCAPVCRVCVEVVENVLTPAYFRRFPEIKDYFKWVSNYVDAHGGVPCLVWDREKNGPKEVRFRGGVDFSAACNNGFQAMLSDVGKLAYYRMTREAYTDSSSVLWGARFPLFLHDEPLSELPVSTAHVAGPRIAEIMIEAGREIAPGVVWKAETALSKFWAKGMEPVYEDGKLVPWEPKGGDSLDSVRVAPALATGERISVTFCVPGDEYMVDCEDGHAPYRMRLREVSAGVFKFVDAVGAKANLGVKDHVWRLSAAALPAPSAPPPPRQPCGAEGCGVMAAPGWVRVTDGGFVECPACRGRARCPPRPWP